MRRAAAVVVLALALPPVANADLASLKDACDSGDEFTLCDDGVPDAGGTTPNPGAAGALAVPQVYGGDGVSGLPPKAPAEDGGGADENGDVALDADLSLPLSGERFPLLILMHTCCSSDKRNFESKTVEASGELWHYSNAWFASRGYAVLNYTSRGFVDAQGRGSTGYTQLDSRRFEVNDLQHLACLLAADHDLDPTRPGDQRIDPQRVVVTGGSYGGGLAWLAMTDPRWDCSGLGHAELQMALAAVAPRYGWTDLVYALVPNGSHMADALPPGEAAESATTRPLGVPRSSIISALYVTGRAGDPRTGGRTTFPPELDQAIACLQSTTPLESSPVCTTTGVVPGIVDEFLADRSPYYQSDYFAGLAGATVEPVPVFSAGSSSSPLFGQVEHRRMAERLRAAYAGYPIQEYYGDVGDFTQNKAKEWEDVGSGASRRVGIATRLNRFIDHYARPAAAPNVRRPAFDVTATLMACEGDEPGERFTESTFAELAPELLRLEASGEQMTTHNAEPNPHAKSADPIANLLTNAGRCPIHSESAGPGVAVYDFPPLERDIVMIGRARVSVPHTGSGSDLQLNARLYEVLEDGRQVLVDRGVRRLEDANATTVFDLNGNAWRFRKGAVLRLELAQDDDPYTKASTQPSSLTLAGVTLNLPVRLRGPDARLRVRRVGRRRMRVVVKPRSRDSAGVGRTVIAVTDLGSRRRVPVRGGTFRAQPGRRYRVRARLFDRQKLPGDPVTIVVPFTARRPPARAGRCAVAPAASGRCDWSSVRSLGWPPGD